MYDLWQSIQSIKETSNTCFSKTIKKCKKRKSKND
jgi:hypothetical protein